MHWAIHVVIGLAGTMAVALLSGCAAPKPIVDAEAAAAKAEAAGTRNLDVIARAAADAYRREAIAHADYKSRVALDRATEPDGKVARETVEAVAKERARIMAEIDVEHDKILRALLKSRIDLDDAAALRAEVRAYLIAEGAGPETVRTVSDLFLSAYGGMK